MELEASEWILLLYSMAHFRICQVGLLGLSLAKYSACLCPTHTPLLLTISASCFQTAKVALILEPTLLVLGHAGHAAEMNTPSLQQPLLTNEATVLRSQLLHLFIVIHSTDFHNIKFRMLYNHWKYEHFYPSLKKTLMLIMGLPSSPSLPPPLPILWQLLIYLVSLWIGPFWTFHTNGIIP